MKRTRNKILTNITLAALIVASAFTLSTHAHPLEKLMPFVTRILWHSENFLSSIQGLWIKKLAEPYGLKCKYPVLVKLHDTPAEAHSSIVEINGTLVATDKKIIFDNRFVTQYLQQGNAQFLIATLVHENEHLEKDHHLKSHQLLQQTIQKRNDKQWPEHRILCTQLDSLHRIFEEEADAAIKHPKLCVAAYNEFLSHANQKYDGICHAISGLRTHEATLRVINPHDLCIGMVQKTIDDYEKQLKAYGAQSPELFKALESDSHPHPMRRALYFLQRTKDADAKSAASHCLRNVG